MSALLILVVAVLSAVPAPVVASHPVRAAPLVARFGWPVSSPRVVRRFDPPPRPWLAGHRGVDLAAGPGASVVVAGAGVVVFVGEVAGRGVVSVAHSGGLRTTYEPVTATVAVGDQLALGEPLGLLVAGHPGCPAPACLHWGLRRDDVYLDPLALLGLGWVRLLPLGGASLSGPL
ncbi:peptidoglycan DD-metalloendopeptidase family protein [Actinoplanes sp. CA-142083]|uniref:peptidoglycan DD-metalloendopeptidase family protein n=1 Tax=Actinoplanes sp. CA-142083 TaxID=3239903 RepID=UPI003D94EC30